MSTLRLLRKFNVDERKHIQMYLKFLCKTHSDQHNQQPLIDAVQKFYNKITIERNVHITWDWLVEKKVFYPPNWTDELQTYYSTTVMEESMQKQIKEAKIEFFNDMEIENIRLHLIWLFQKQKDAVDRHEIQLLMFAYFPESLKDIKSGTRPDISLLQTYILTPITWEPLLQTLYDNSAAVRETQDSYTSNADVDKLFREIGGKHVFF